MANPHHSHRSLPKYHWPNQFHVRRHTKHARYNIILSRFADLKSVETRINAWLRRVQDDFSCFDVITFPLRRSWRVAPHLHRSLTAGFVWITSHNWSWYCIICTCHQRSKSWMGMLTRLVLTPYLQILHFSNHWTPVRGGVDSRSTTSANEPIPAILQGASPKVSHFNALCNGWCISDLAGDRLSLAENFGQMLMSS